MRTFAQKQNQPQKPVSSSLARPKMPTSGPACRDHPIVNLNRTIGNQAAQQMLQTDTKELEAGLTGAASARFGHDFSQIPIHPPAGGTIQTKLAINKRGDKYEEEADRVADQVMHMPDAQKQPPCACGGGCHKCQAERSGQKHEYLQAERTRASDAGETLAPPIAHEVLQSLGRPLDSATRAFVEPRFGHDFSQLRVHSDAKAAGVAAIRRQNEPDPAAPPAQAPAVPTGPTQGQEAQPADTSSQAGGGPKLYGLLAHSIGGPLTFSPWAFGAQQEPGVGIHSPLMSAYGTVLADTSVPVAQYEIGFVQALLVSNMTATYTDRDGRAVQYLQIGVSQQPIRDSLAGSKPWSKQQDVKSLDAKEGYIVNTQDRPRNMAPWQTPDRLGSLSRAEGTDYFCTWLAARHKPSGQMHYLGWGTWTVDWGSAFDAASQTGRSTGAGGQEGLSGDKKGPLTPLEGDPVANDSITVRWSATP